MNIDRFSHLPPENNEFFFCMICLTKNKARYENFLSQKQNLPDLALFDAITPEVDGFDEQRSKFNFHPMMIRKKGDTALWLSQIVVFEHFLKSNHKYLVLLEDDAMVPNNFQDILEKTHINHEEFLDLGGTRLGQYASGNLYNKFCVTNILTTINTYPIDRGLDHYASDIRASGTGQPRPFNLRCGLKNVEKVVKVNPVLSNNSARIQFNKKS